MGERAHAPSRRSCQRADARQRRRVLPFHPALTLSCVWARVCPLGVQALKYERASRTSTSRQDLHATVAGLRRRTRWRPAGDPFIKNIGFQNVRGGARQEAIIVDAFEAWLRDALLAGVVLKSSASRRVAPASPSTGGYSSGQEYARPQALSARASGSRAPRRCVHASAPRGRKAARTSAQRLWLGLCARAGECRILCRVSHSFEWRVSLRAVAACATRVAACRPAAHVVH